VSEINFLLALSVLIYIGLFFAMGKTVAKTYLKEKPFETIKDDAANVDPGYYMERIRDVVRHAERSEEISLILCGFTILSLVFIISSNQDDLAAVEDVVALFSMAFIIEIISAFFYHDTRSNLYTFSGMVFQYAGLLAMLLGFISYLSGVMSWSLIVLLIYVIGVIVFAILTFNEIKFFAEYSRELDEKKKPDE